MDEECLKLTAYMAERRRTDDGFVSDVLLGLYEEYRVASSIVLRGVGGFGAGHQIRTDESLTLSENPPVAIVAVDTRTKIEALFDDVLAIKRRGLVTLERARLLGDEIMPVQLPDELHEAVKLTIYVGRGERVYGVPAYIAICDLLYRREVAGASVFVGVDGIMHGHRERATFFGPNSEVPMMIIAVGSGERIGRVLPELGGLLRRPVMTIERVRVCKRDGELFVRPHDLPETDQHGLPLWQKLMIYTSESAHYEGEPIHRALIRRLRRRRAVDGATVLSGIWGFHGDHQPHGDRVRSLRRRVPALTIIIDTPGDIAESFEVVDEVTRNEGLVTCEMVPALVSDEGDPQQGRPPMAHHPY